MALLQHLAGIALHQALGDSAEVVSKLLVGHFSDHSQRLTRALTTAAERAWKALEIAIAGDSWWQRLKVAQEDQSIVRQVRAFLDGLPLPVGSGKDQLCQQCLRELRQARSRNALGGSLDTADLARQVGPLGSATPQALVQAQERALHGAAAELKEAGFTTLAWMIEQQPQAGKPLLVLAVRYFFRREVETDPELARGLTLAQLDDLSQAQQSGFLCLSAALAQHGQRLEAHLRKMQETLDEVDRKLDVQSQQIQQLTRAVQEALQRHQLMRPELAPRDSLSIRNESERQLVKQLMDQYRRLPAAQQHRLPALLSDLGRLQVAAGDFACARDCFTHVVRLARDESEKAQAHYNAYRAALEEHDWPRALDHLLEAVRLEPKRFAPFPVGKYQPRRILGAGGFGVAFLCQHKHLDAPLVVKALLLEELDRAVENVFQEAKLLSQLDDPAFVRIWDVGYIDSARRSRPYLVMDYFDGVSLEDQVRDHGPLSLADVKEIGRTVAEALLAAHAKQILHRDVKPANVLVRRDPTCWRVKLIDFGLALKQSALEDTAHAGRTLAGESIAGTLDYAAPEQMGRLEGVGLGPHSDVYGFAKTCYFALLGTPAPDDRQKAKLPLGWRKLLADCTAHPPHRLADFAVVLKRLKGLKVTKRRVARKQAPERVTQPVPDREDESPPPSSTQPAGRIQVACPHCRRALVARQEDAGRSLRCQHCAGVFVLPKPSQQRRPQPATEGTGSASAMVVACPHCRQQFAVSPAMSAQGQARCPRCSRPFLLQKPGR